jgi:hypothetical protein
LPVDGSGQAGLELWAKEEKEQWYEKAPGYNPAGEIQRGKPRPDYVTYAQIGRANRRG